LQVLRCWISCRVLFPTGNVSEGGWKRHHGLEVDTQWSFQRGK
jgi:hypothetical protein